jgi:hypothetical protein
MGSSSWIAGAYGIRNAPPLQTAKKAPTLMGWGYIEEERRLQGGPGEGSSFLPHIFAMALD